MSDFRMRSYQKNALSNKAKHNNKKEPVVKQAVLSPFTEKEICLSLYKDSQENLLKNWIESRLLSKEQWQEKRRAHLDPEKVAQTLSKNQGYLSKAKQQLPVKQELGLMEGFTRQGDFCQLEKVSKFLLTLPKEKVSEIFKHLDDKELEAIVRQMIKTPCVKNPVEVYELHQDFKKSLNATKKQLKGGKFTAKAILTKAVGKEKAQQVLDKVEIAQKVPFEFLQDLDEKQIWDLLKGESSAVLALVFSFLNRTQAKYIVNKLDSKPRKDLLLRLGRMERVHVQILHSVEEKIQHKAQRYFLSGEQNLKGRQVLAEILQYMKPSEEEKLLSSLKLEKEQKEELEEMLFNMDVVLRIQDEDLHKVLKDYSPLEIALLLKGKKEEQKLKILGNLSKRRQEDVDQEFLAVGRVYLKEVDLITKRFLEDLKERHENGQICIFRKNEEFIT